MPKTLCNLMTTFISELRGDFTIHGSGSLFSLSSVDFGGWDFPLRGRNAMIPSLTYGELIGKRDLRCFHEAYSSRKIALAKRAAALTPCEYRWVFAVPKTL